MALEFIDSFNHYTTADLRQKGWSHNLGITELDYHTIDGGVGGGPTGDNHTDQASPADGVQHHGSRRHTRSGVGTLGPDPVDQQ